MGCINHPSSNDIDQIIGSLVLALVNVFVPTDTHGSDYQRARKEFMRSSLDDPNVAGRIKGWVKNEMRDKGESGYWRSPPGFDVGHREPGINSPDNFRWENSDMNRSRGGKHHR